MYPTRRQVLAAVPAVALVPISSTVDSSWKFCLNTSTIRGQKIPITDEVDIAAKAGYHAIEPWVNEIDRFVQSSGALADLRKRVSDAGLAVADIIGFPEWIVDDDAKRTKGFDEAKRAMDLARQLGCDRIAAPPIGAHQANAALVNPNKIADRFFKLAELGATMGVRPLIEVWGFAPNLKTLTAAVSAAVTSGHATAAVLPDVYHLRKGDSPVAGLGLLGPDAIGIFHVNDYPGDKPIDKLVDADRVYPGDGAAPWRDIFAALARSGYRGYLSLELFNPDYWKQDALVVARTGREKLQALTKI